MQLIEQLKNIVFVILIILIASSVNYAQEDKYELNNIDFKGNKSISSSELKGIISSQETPNFFFKFLNDISESIGKPPSYFDSSKIPVDIRSIQNYYKDNGFFEVTVSSIYNLDDDDKEAEMIFNVSEGPQFIIRKFELRGLEKNVPEEFILKIHERTNIDSADFFVKDVVEENRLIVLNYLRDRGYMLVTPNRPEVLIDTVGNFVDVVIGFDTGIRYKISEVRVEKTGYEKSAVRDTLLKKLVGIKQGHYYSNDEINRGQVRLFRTNLFSSVLVNTVVADTHKNQVPLRISADIAPLNELIPEIIVNNQESTLNFGLGLSYSRKNFLGDARNFLLSSSFAFQDIFNIDYSKLFKFFTVNDTSIFGYFDNRLTIEQPYLFGKPIRTKLEGYSTINKIKEYRSTTYGAKLSLDFELPRIVYFKTLTTYYNFERSVYEFVEIYLKDLIEDAGYSPDSINTSDISRDFSSSILGLETGVNRTDNLLFPTKGYTLLLSFEEANSLPYLFDKHKTQFYRFTSKFTFFPKLYKSENNAFGLKLKLGYIQVFKGPTNAIPFNKRFTAGGSNSLRGWRSRNLPDVTPSLSNLDLQDLIDLIFNKVKIGGTFLLEGSFETRNRIAGPLGGALFVDYGNVWDGYKKFRFDEIAVAVGFGLRLYTSFAPIRIDFGFKGYDPSDEKTLWKKLKHSPFFDNIEFHFGIGEAF